jgi:hypothetical protein
VIGDPPSEGLVHETVRVPAPGTTLRLAGVEGVVAVVADARLDQTLCPIVFVAATCASYFVLVASPRIATDKVPDGRSSLVQASLLPKILYRTRYPASVDPPSFVGASQVTFNVVPEADAEGERGASGTVRTRKDLGAVTARLSPFALTAATVQL